MNRRLRLSLLIALPVAALALSLVSNLRRDRPVPAAPLPADALPEKKALAPLKDESPHPITRMPVDGVEVTFAHAPSTLVRPVPPNAVRGTVQFGFVPSAYEDPSEYTDGGLFTVELVTPRGVSFLASREMNPVKNPADRGMQRFNFDLPVHSGDARLLLRVDSGRNTSRDWSYWADVAFE